MTVSSGARWYRVDLHVHTPFDPTKEFGEDIRASLEAGSRGDSSRIEQIAQRFWDACCAAASEEGLDLIALTDHNSVDGYEHLAPAVRRIAAENGRVISILPGVEFSVGGERLVHFLAIFSASTTPDQVRALIHHVFGTRDPIDSHTGVPNPTGESVGRFLEKIYEYCLPRSGERRIPFVLLPAHADGESGIAKVTGTAVPQEPSIWTEMRGHLREWAIVRTEWHGFETSREFARLPEAMRGLLLKWRVGRRGEEWDKLTDDQRETYRRAQHWPLIEASDPRGYEGLGRVWTWLKMEERDVEGIRLALLDPESRLRRMQEGAPVPDYPVIAEIGIVDTDFFEDLALEFSPSLNVLIGGRGTGKSSVIEYLRYGLDRVRPEDFQRSESEIRDNVENFLRRKPARDFGETAGTLLPSHRISLRVELAGRRYNILRDSGGCRASAEDGGQIDIRALVAPRFVSQEQISRMAREPAALRRELDALVDSHQLLSLLDDERDIETGLVQLQTTRDRLRQRQRELPGKETELRTTEDHIAFLEKGGAREALETYRAVELERKWLDQVAGLITDVTSDLSGAAKTLRSRLTRLGAVPDSPNRMVMDRVRQVALNAIEAAIADVRTQEETLVRAGKEILEERERSWAPSYAEAQRAYAGVQDELKRRGVDFSAHQGLVRRRGELLQEIEALRLLGAELATTAAEIDKVQAAFVSVRESRRKLREEGAAGLERADADVRLAIVPFGDKNDFSRRREEWFGGTGLQERDWDLLAGYVFVSDDGILERLRGLVRALETDIQRAELGRIEPSGSAIAELLGADHGLTGFFFNALQRGSRIRVSEMECFLPEDLVRATVRGADGRFKPIDQGSLGQRSMAVLSLLLSAGQQPLIVDQPEADLDNEYVYQVVVPLLRREKFLRQIIVASHNANVSVNGDAELIVSLGVDDRIGCVRCAGSIDREDMKMQVSLVMEGSAEAFRLRQERYGF